MSHSIDVPAGATLEDAYAAGRADQQDEDIAFRLRIARLLAELHGNETLSEQQCARYMGIDLVSWRRLEHCFSAGTSFVEGGDDDFPAEDSESVLRDALARGAA
jgi:hypothetical protein